MHDNRYAEQTWPVWVEYTKSTKWSSYERHCLRTGQHGRLQHSMRQKSQRRARLVFIINTLLLLLTAKHFSVDWKASLTTSTITISIISSLTLTRFCALLNSGYIWNKTETKQFCFSFISDVVTCEMKQKQNTETILKSFRIVSELFQAH